MTAEEAVAEGQRLEAMYPSAVICINRDKTSGVLFEGRVKIDMGGE
jgi:hypothetical protein